MQMPRGGLITVDALERVQRSGAGAGPGAGPLTEVIPGLLASREVRPHWLAAIEKGWRPTCTTALAAHGLWVPRLPESSFHGYRRRSRRSDGPTGTVSHGWHHSWPESSSVASIILALEHAISCRDAETALIIAESALNRGALSMDRWTELVEQAPVKKRPLLSKARDDAQSGSETRVRLGFESRRIPVESQVVIDGVGRVDLLVGGVLVVECDSRAHHSGTDAYDRDRRRDFALQRLGYVVIRLSYPQIWQSWPETLEQLIAAYRQIRHRRRRPLATGGR